MLLITILLWWFFAKKSAIEEAAFTWPFRNIEEGQFMGNLNKLTKTFHKEGALYVIAHSIGYASLIGFATSLKGFSDIMSLSIAVITAVICLLVYWLFFDPYYSKAISQPWYYLGDTAKTDSWLIKTFGNIAGRLKAGFCVVMIIVLTGLYYLLTGFTFI